MRFKILSVAYLTVNRYIVRLEPDVAAIFPNAEAVNEALRFLIRVTRENQPT
ncbi:MAG: hypothetical protein ACRAVC_05025 [Trichormus sp.]